MKDKPREKLLAKAAPYLSTGEPVRVTAFVNVGSVARGREAAKLAGMMMVSGIATGGLLAIGKYKKPRPMYTVVTDRQMLLFSATGLGQPGEFEAALPLNGLALVETKGAVALVVVLAIAGADDNLQVQFPLPSKAEGKVFVTLIPPLPPS